MQELWCVRFSGRWPGRFTHPSTKVGDVTPFIFQGGWARLGAVWNPEIDDFQSAENLTLPHSCSPFLFRWDWGPKSDQNRSESLCASLWVPCRICWACFDLAFRPKSGSKSKIPGRTLTSFRGPVSSADYIPSIFVGAAGRAGARLGPLGPSFKGGSIGLKAFDKGLLRF